MPGRARLRVPKPRTPNQVQRVVARVQASKRVRHVSSNPATGGMLVSFNPEDPIDLIIDDLRMVGLEIASVLDESRVFRTQSTGAVIVRQVFGKANARLALPALYLALAARNFMTQRARLRDVSWYQLLYWAFDSFFKLHEELTVKETARTHGRVVD
jgi:hypothetical protein